jgi:hypothetical protein
MSVCVNQILSIWPQNLCYGNCGGEWPVIWRSVKDLWDEIDSVLRKRDKLRDEAQAKRRFEEALAHQEKHKQRDHDELIHLVLMEACRRASEALSQDIESASMATRRAYQQAVRDSEIAREALEKAQRNAIVLANGHAVYFDREGRLFAEDLTQVTNTEQIAEARGLHHVKPHATTFEVYAERHRNHTETDNRVQTLSQILSELDELKEKQRTGQVTTEGVQRRRDELDRILGSMPPDVLAEYDRLRSARTGSVDPAYRQVDTAFTALPQLHSEFARAGNALTKHGEPESNAETKRQPAYKTVPDF